MAEPIPRVSLGVLAGIVRNDQVLLVRRSYRERRWQLPGGFVEPAESPASALLRELREELAVNAAVNHLIGTYLRDTTEIVPLHASFVGERDLVLLFAVELLGQIRVNSPEIEDAAYFTAETLPVLMSARNRRMALDVLERCRGAYAFFGRVGL